MVTWSQGNREFPSKDYTSGNGTGWVMVGVGCGSNKQESEEHNPNYWRHRIEVDGVKILFIIFKLGIGWVRLEYKRNFKETTFKNMGNYNK